MKVLQLVTRSDWAGAQKVLYTLVIGLKQQFSEDFEVEIVCGQYDGTLISELEELGFKVHVITDLVREISPIKDLKAFLQIYKLLRQNNYGIIHCHSSKVRLLGGIAAKIAKVKKVIYTIHGWWHVEQYSGLKRRLSIVAERLAACFADKIVLLCKKDLEKARSWKIGKDPQYEIIPNAIVPIEEVQKGQLRKELGIDESVKIIGNVARLDPPKNPIRFLETAKLVLSKKDDVVFVWIGGSVVDDYYGKEVQKWLENNSYLKEKIHFLPFRKDAIQLMSDFDVFLLTSDSEGMPLVVLEALALGIPIVSTDVGCVGEIVENTVSNATAESLSSEVFKVLTNRLYHDQYSRKTTDIRFFIDEYVSKCYLEITKDVNHK